MSRRDICLISNYEEAQEWLAEFKHTITDEQVLKVINILGTEIELFEHKLDHARK